MMGGGIGTILSSVLGKHLDVVGTHSGPGVKAFFCKPDMMEHQVQG